MKQIKLGNNQGSCLCTFYNNGKANVMMIDSFEVDAAYRRQGIGTKLMARAIKLAHARKVDSIELTVNKDNIPAQRLYEKFGLEKTNKDYYRLILNKK